MDRTQYLLDILEAAAHKQHHVSVILEAKSIESAKARNWMCIRVGNHEFTDHDELLKHCGSVHEQMIEVIDAMTKLESGLAKNLKIVLGHNDDSGGGGMSMFDGFGGFGGGMGGGDT